MTVGLLACDKSIPGATTCSQNLRRRTAVVRHASTPHAPSAAGFHLFTTQVLGGITGAGLAASALDGTSCGFNALAPGVDVSAQSTCGVAASVSSRPNRLRAGGTTGECITPRTPHGPENQIFSHVNALYSIMITVFSRSSSYLMYPLSTVPTI